MRDWTRYVRSNLSSLPIDPIRESEIVQELAQHLEAVHDDALAGGASEAEAERIAERELADWRLLESEICRSERPLATLVGSRSAAPVAATRGRAPTADWLEDLRYGWRKLRRQPGFVATTVLTLALAIGATTALYSVLHAVLLSPLPYEDPERLALIRGDVEGLERMASLSAPELVDFREQSRQFEGFAAIWQSTAALADPGELPEQIDLAWATRNLFSLLGREPVLGRTFTAEEELENGPHVVLLSEELWRRRYGADPDILGRTLLVDDVERTVVGVLPAGLRMYLGKGTNVTDSIDAWVPQTYWINRGLRWLRVIGRVREGVTLEEAQAEMDAIAARLRDEHAEYKTSGLGLHVVPLHDDLVSEVEPAVVALFVAVLFVLLIACANVTNLMLARMRGRSAELAIRTVLGASRFRVARQIVVECLLLTAVAAGLGLLVAHAGLRWLVTLDPALPRIDRVGLDRPVLLFAAGLALAVSLLFAVAPAWRGASADLHSALRGASRHVARTPTRSILVVVEVALSLVLLVGAGLMIRTVLNLARLDPGFVAEGLLTFEVGLSHVDFPTAESQLLFFEQLAEGAGALPGVEAVGATSVLPLSGRYFTGAFAFDATSEAAFGALSADYLTVLPGYFEAMAARLTEGRSLTRRDGHEQRRVVVVDETLARLAWPGERAIGRRILVDPHGGTTESAPEWVEVVGVVEHIRDQQLTAPGRPQIYLPFLLSPDRSLVFTVRTAKDPLALVAPVRDLVLDLGSTRPVHRVRTMEELIAARTSEPRFTLFLMGLFAGLALLLAVVGLYGVIAYRVGQRTHEFGVRLALGARFDDIVRLVLREGALLALAGIAIGLVAAVSLSRFLEHLLYGVSGTDPWTLGALSLLLGGVALTACYFPARRGARVETTTALRQD